MSECTTVVQDEWGDWYVTVPVVVGVAHYDGDPARTAENLLNERLHESKISRYNWRNRFAGVMAVGRVAKDVLGE